jgi:hypothetical protein
MMMSDAVNVLAQRVSLTYMGIGMQLKSRVCGNSGVNETLHKFDF